MCETRVVSKRMNVHPCGAEPIIIWPLSIINDSQLVPVHLYASRCRLFSCAWLRDRWTWDQCVSKRRATSFHYHLDSADYGIFLFVHYNHLLYCEMATFAQHHNGCITSSVQECGISIDSAGVTSLVLSLWYVFLYLLLLMQIVWMGFCPCT